MAQLVLATGFEPFEEHAENPSGDVALGLTARPPAGVEVVSAVLPVSFGRVEAAFDAALETLGGRRPDLILAMGVHKRPGWRVEGWARPHLGMTDRPDTDGVSAAEGTATRAADAEPLRSSLDVSGLTLSLAELTPEGAGLSWDAGGYVCECVYWAALERARRLRSQALFVHVPPARFTRVETQVERMRGLLRLALG